MTLDEYQIKAEKEYIDLEKLKDDIVFAYAKSQAENDELRKEIDRLTKIIGKDIERHLSEKDLVKKTEPPTFETPSPTGDRDCEELKKEVERLKGLIEMVHTDAYGISPFKWLQFKEKHNL